MDNVQMVLLAIGANVITNLLLLIAVLRINRRMKGEKGSKLARPNRRPSNY